MEEITRTVRDSAVETMHIVRPGDLNDAGRLYGGVLMSWIDEVAALVGRRHTRMQVTTAAVENLEFLHGAYQKDIIVISGRVTFVANTSMEVRVDTYVEHQSGQRDLINRAFMTLIGLDDNNRPARVPRLQISTDEEREAWESAEMRRNMRARQTKEGFYFYGKQ